MLPLNETIKDIETRCNYITEDQGAIPAGLRSAIVYLRTFRQILNTADKKDLKKIS